MTAWRVGLLAVLLFGGCQSGGNTELLERQLRIQEDRIYQLEDELERHCKLLTACRKEGQALKSTGTPTVPAATPATATPQRAPSPQPIPDLTPPKIEFDLPPAPPPSSSSNALPLLNAPLTGELIESAASDESSLRIRMPSSETLPPPSPRAERVVDQSAATLPPPRAPTEAPGETTESTRQAKLPPAPRRPSWSPYR